MNVGCPHFLQVRRTLWKMTLCQQFVPSCISRATYKTNTVTHEIHIKLILLSVCAETANSEHMCERVFCTVNFKCYFINRVISLPVYNAVSELHLLQRVSLICGCEKLKLELGIEIPNLPEVLLGVVIVLQKFITTPKLTKNISTIKQY